jgi:hypothetical protein
VALAVAVKALTYQALVALIIGAYLAVLHLQQTLEQKVIQVAVLVAVVEQMLTLLQVLVVTEFLVVAVVDVIRQAVELILVEQVAQV